MRRAGVILAGGRSSRMGHDKALVLLEGRTLLAHIVASLEQKVGAMLINSNGDPARFAVFGHPVLADCVPGRRGPLAGILTGLFWTKQNLPGITHLLSVPCDIPGLPRDIGDRLTHALAWSGADIAVARDACGLQPTIGLWPITFADRLASDLVDREMRGMQHWISQFRVAEVRCSILHNINTPADLLAARHR